MISSKSVQIHAYLLCRYKCNELFTNNSHFLTVTLEYLGSIYVSKVKQKNAILYTSLQWHNLHVFLLFFMTNLQWKWETLLAMSCPRSSIQRCKEENNSYLAPPPPQKKKKRKKKKEKRNHYNHRSLLLYWTRTTFTLFQPPFIKNTTCSDSTTEGK